MREKTDTSWVFVRGLAREPRHWDSFISVFEQAFGSNIHFAELPGTGKYHRQPSPASIEKIVDQMEQNEALPSGQHLLLAHSMGALVGLEMIRRCPGNFAGAVFVNTSIGGVSPTFKRLRKSAFQIFGSYLLSSKSEWRREEMKFAMTSNIPDIKDDTIRKWLEIQKTAPVSWTTIGHQLIAAALYRTKKPALPILLLNSLGDQMVHPICSEKIHKKWGSMLRTHLWAGHDIFIDDPKWVTTQIKTWFQQSLTV